MFEGLFSKSTKFDDVAEMPADTSVPPLDRKTVSDSALTPEQKQWRDEGVVIMRKAIPDDLIARYSDARASIPHTEGFPTSYAYLSVPELRDIALHDAVGRVMEQVMSVKLALHFDLTQWVTTERDWHQNDYLNPPEINSWYLAAWFALDDVHPDSGPFEYAPGSHRWPVVRGHKVRSRMKKEEANSSQWPQLSEKIVTKVYEDKLAESGLPTKKFIAQKGDVLIWHGRLLHRGTRANVRHMPRKALITHYTAVNKITPEQHELAHSQAGYPYIVHRGIEPFAWPPR